MSGMDGGLAGGMAKEEIMREYEVTEEDIWAALSCATELIETHISWVILTDDFVYKIKKPVNLGFVDATTRTSRKHFCEEELRLNRRWAAEIYLDVVRICGSFEKPTVGGIDTPIEYAIKMLQFPQTAQLDAQLGAGLLTGADMAELAEMIAEQHGSASVRSQKSAKDAVELIRHPMLENIE